jgi:hypothetical protein
MRRPWFDLTPVRGVGRERRAMVPRDPHPLDLLETARPMVETYTPVPTALYALPEYAAGIGDEPDPHRRRGGYHR